MRLGIATGASVSRYVCLVDAPRWRTRRRLIPQWLLGVRSLLPVRAESVSLEEQWWRDWLRGALPFAMGWVYLAVGLLFVGVALFAHKGQALPLGVIVLVSSAVHFAAWAVRRRRRSRQDSDAQ